MYYVLSIKFFRRYWPFLFILIIWFLFSYPYFLQGRVPYSSTYQVNSFAPWDGYPGFASPVKNGAMPDVTTQIIPWKHFTIQTYKEGQIPLWNPDSFSGTPHLANYQSAVLSPFNLLFFILPFVDGWSMLVLLQPLLAGFFTYIFMRKIRASVIGSLISSISFMFCGFIVVWMDYATLAYAALFLPLSLYSIESFFDSKKLRFLVLLSFTFPLSFFSGHFAISSYFLIVVLCYLVYKYFITKNFNLFLQCSLYGFFGMLFILPQVLPTIELYGQSLRSQLFQKVEVIPWGYLPTFIAPDFFGNPVTRNDWFGHYAEWNGYIGVIPFILAFYSLKLKQTKVWFFWALGILALLFAFQTPFLDAIVQLHVPVFSTSAASRVIIIFIFSFVVLSGMGFDSLLQDLTSKKRLGILAWLSSFLLVFFVLWLIVFFKIGLPLSKISIAKQNLLLPTMLFIVFSGLLGFFIFLKQARKEKFFAMLGILILVIVCFDSLRFATKWQAFDPKALFFPKVPVANFFPKILDHQKVIGNFGAETSVYYNLPSLEGYDAVYNRRYGEFIASLQTLKLEESPRSVVTFPKNTESTPKAINLLNVAYIIHKTSDDFTGWTFPYWQYPTSQFSLLYSDNSYRIYKNNAVYPHAFFANNFVVQSDPQKIITTMFTKNFDLSKTLVLEKDPQLKSTDSQVKEQVTIKNYTPSKITIKASSSANGFIFLSDSYFPGWEAYVNNKKVEIFRADFAFRAVKIGKGESTIVFIYNPVSFRIGLYFALLGLFGLLLFTVLFKKLKI